MKLKRAHDEYDISATKGVDEIIGGRIRSNTVEAFSYAMNQMAYDELRERIVAAAKANGDQPVLGVPVYFALRPDHEAIAVFPCPDKDYEATFRYATIKEM